MVTPAGPSYKEQGRGWMRYPSGGLLWFLYRVPLVEWRMGLALILRRFRFLVLTSRGRKSGKPRHTMLEHSMMGGRAFIASGWGAKTQWYRNILSDARVTVQISGKPYGAIARRVADDDELARLYEVIRGKSPVWGQYLHNLDSWGVQDTVQDFVAKKDTAVHLAAGPSGRASAPRNPDRFGVYLARGSYACYGGLFHCALNMAFSAHI